MREGIPCIRWVILNKNCCEEAVFTGHVGIFDILDDSVTSGTCCICGSSVTHWTMDIWDEGGALLTNVSVIV